MYAINPNKHPMVQAMRLAKAQAPNQGSQTSLQTGTLTKEQASNFNKPNEQQVFDAKQHAENVRNITNRLAQPIKRKQPFSQVQSPQAATADNQLKNPSSTNEGQINSIDDISLLSARNLTHLEIQNMLTNFQRDPKPSNDDRMTLQRNNSRYGGDKVIIPLSKLQQTQEVATIRQYAKEKDELKSTKDSFLITTSRMLKQNSDSRYAQNRGYKQGVAENE